MFQFLDNITIRNKLIMICSFTVVGMIIFILIEILFASRINEFNKAQLNIEQMGSSMLMLRRNEKDYLARNDEKYVGKFNDNLQKLIDQTKNLEAATGTLGINKSADIRSLREVFESYHLTFLEIAKLKQEIGLTPTTGLYGALRSSVHAAEKSIKELEDWEMLANTLMLRRREKDFMLRYDTKYLDKFEKDFITINQTLSLRDYPPEINQFVKANLDAYA